MFLDIAPTEFLLTAIVAVVVIGPKDLPMALRTAGRWMGKIRRVSNHFRSGIETMIREAEMAEMEEQWRKQNEAIMAAHPAAEPLPGAPPEPAASPPAAPAPAAVAHDAHDDAATPPPPAPPLP